MGLGVSHFSVGSVANCCEQNRRRVPPPLPSPISPLVGHRPTFHHPPMRFLSLPSLHITGQTPYNTHLLIHRLHCFFWPPLAPLPSLADLHRLSIAAGALCSLLLPIWGEPRAVTEGRKDVLIARGQGWKSDDSAPPPPSPYLLPQAISPIHSIFIHQYLCALTKQHKIRLLITVGIRGLCTGAPNRIRNPYNGWLSRAGHPRFEWNQILIKLSYQLNFSPIFLYIDF